MNKGILIAVLILVLIIVWVIDLLWSAGQFKMLEPHFDGKILYLCATTERTLHIFGREPTTGKLIQQEKIKLNSGIKIL